jgi:3-hydroxyisobutyrate dehydrogenase
MNSQNIGWIGTGVMGASMASHLLNAGYKLYIHNRTTAKAQSLIDAGAIFCETPAEVAQHVDLTFLMVGYPEDVESTILGQDGILSEARQNSTIVDMTTSKPSLAVMIYKAAKERNVSVLDAPVSGGDIGARNATLAIMVGGDVEVFEKTKPFFEIMGKTIAYFGPAGSGQHTKMSNQILVAGTMIGVVESLLYAKRAGLNLQSVIEVIGSGAAGSWSINNLGPRIVKGDFDPGFYIKHFVKDMGIALEEAKQLNLTLPGLALVNQFYQAAIAQGLENLGTQGLFKVLDQLSRPL